MNDDDDQSTFIRFEGLGGPEGTVLTRGAFQMHSFGVLKSFDYGTPGFVPDEYLNSISADSTTEVLELCAAGLWCRADNDLGYDVLDEEIIEQFRQAREVVAEMDPDGE